MAGKNREVEVEEKQGKRATNVAVGGEDGEGRRRGGGVQGQEKGERETHTEA